jgi:hypothetical protein
MVKFKKITPVNGFDSNDSNNAMQNNYAWSMAELGDYIYVGTGRNILYLALGGLGLEVPKYLLPDPVDMNGEIWRYKKDGTKSWERVYKAPAELTIFGFRFMIQYTLPSGETALYAGANTFKPQITLLKSTDGVNWIPLVTTIQGTSTRSMEIHNNKLYMGVLSEIIGGKALLYESTDPERKGWKLISFEGDPDKNPRGGIDNMLSFNNKLYIATSPPGGFEVWRTKGREPCTNGWKLVVDKGAGDALNEIPLILKKLGRHLYVGTAIAEAIVSVDPEKQFVPPKGADLIRIYKNDRWEVIVGGKPIAPTNPITGSRNKGYYPSGFGDISNAYIWQLQEHDDEFYLGTFDWSNLILPLISSLMTSDKSLANTFISEIGNPTFMSRLGSEYNCKEWLKSVIDSLKDFSDSMGFDLYESEDGEKWEAISLDGLGNICNYGLRTFLVASDGRLYLGTANPFQGCEVWVKGDNNDEEEDDEEDNDWYWWLKDKCD